MRLRTLRANLVSAISGVRREGRHVWSNGQRVHLELRAIDPEDLCSVGPELESALGELDGVAWARIHPSVHRVVVAYDAARIAPRDIAAALGRTEARLGFDAEAFDVARPERHPGDIQPLRRTAFELGADSWALVMAVATRLGGFKPAPFQIDLAALLSLIENVPAIRKPIERVAGIPGTELLLDVANACTRAFLQAELGSIAEVMNRSLRLRELYARRKLWVAWEAELFADPASYPAIADACDADERPLPKPRGAVEEYASKATAASLGAFGLGLASSHQAESAAGAIFAGLPKAARVGRESFASHFGARLASAGVLVTEPQILRKLDRIDTVVLDEALGDDARGAIETAARGAGLRIKRCGTDEARSRIRQQQRRGRGVCFVGVGPSAGYASADFAIGVRREGLLPPWGAHVLCHSETVARGVVAGIGAARHVSRQSVGLAACEAAIGIVMSSAGLEEGTTRRILSAGGAISILAMSNGVRLAHEVELPKPPPPVDPTPWHSLEVDDAITRLGTRDAGLSSDEARARRAPRPRSASRARKLGRALAAELINPMTPLLVAGAGLSAMTGSRTDAALILGVMGANTIFGGAERFQTELAIDRLAHAERRTVRVRRDGSVVEIDTDELVRGDVVELEAGDVVPADARVLIAEGLEADESSLTGESLPVGKLAEPSLAAALAERASMLYDGTAIAAGRAVAVVTAVGDDTEARRAIAMARAGTSRDAGVEQRLEKLTKLAGPVAGAAGAVIAAGAAIRGRPPTEIISAGVSLAVAAVPEGLPLLATISQLSAARRLSERGALVRNPRAVEALGRVDVVCADKTATLTEGRIDLALVSDGAVDQPIGELDDLHRGIVATALRASPEASNGSPLPHLTDRALVEGARRAGIDIDEGRGEVAREHELPFEPGRGFHAGIARHDGDRLLSAKGAPELLLPRCTGWRRGTEVVELDDSRRRELLDEATRLARRGVRVLAVAERSAPSGAELDDDNVQDLCFEGYIGLSDPVRPTARSAIDSLRRAGIKTVMVTGDHPSTAEAIAAELELGAGEVLSGPELDELDDTGLDARIGRVSVFARVTPAQKLRIVAAYQRIGHIVAMTGDGANDAPAIRLADVGIALGRRSTEAARSAADLVVTDERIETIVSAVLEGRALWSSVRDAISILVGGNLGEIGFTLFGGLLDGRSPLSARQLLLINLVTDTLPALAIASAPPRGVSPEELLGAGAQSVLGKDLEREITWRAIVTGGTSSLAWLAARATGSAARARTVGLVALTGTQMAQTLLAGGRSKGIVLTSAGSMLAVAAAVQTPVVSHFFGCRPLGPLGWTQAAAATVAGGAASLVVPPLIRRLEVRKRPGERAPGPAGTAQAATVR